MATASIPKVTLSRDCLGGQKIVEVHLPRRVTLDDLDRLEGVSERTVLRELPRPFFRLDVAGRFLLTGIVDDPDVRFTVRRSLAEAAVDVALEASATLLGTHR